MRIDRFKAKRIHGYLDFNVTFNKRLTFLTGINGSGKTTAITAIVALITPDLVTLSHLRFDKIELQITHEKRKIHLWAEGTDDDFNLFASDLDNPLTIPRFLVDSESPNSRQAEKETDFFRDVYLREARHPVMQLIRTLPTPMFLGLDRRAQFDVDDRHRPFAPWRYTRTGRNVFSPSLSRSLADAVELATTSNRNALISAGGISDELRRDLILQLLDVSQNESGNITSPSMSDIRQISQIRQDLDIFPRIFGLPRDDVRKRIEPFLNQIQETADAIPQGTNVDELLSSKSRDNILLTNLFRWSTSSPQLKRIRVISQSVERFNERRTEVMAPVEKYKKLVNAFLKDSGKSIVFDREGYIHVSIGDVDDLKEISSLSSGEAQIFVILTHLSFNEAAMRANIFIIDEPELSLHVLWRELFVDSLLAANDQMQYVMATHSPSIILDKIADCKDIQGRKVT